jgi:hypothetical protein
LALNLRRAILRNAIVNTVICLVLSLSITYFTGSLDAGLGNLAWPFAMALGIGIFTAFQTMYKIKHGVLKGIPKMMGLVHVDRADFADVNWSLIDDYGAQLQSRGYQAQGDFCMQSPPPGFRGVASYFINDTTTTIVEVQHITQVLNPKHMPAGTTDVHFSICSCLAGRAPVTVTDRIPAASNYILKSSQTVVATYPGLSLMALLDKQTALLTFLHEKTGQVASAGLTMERYLLLQREWFANTYASLSKLNGYQIASNIDAFEAAPRQHWSAEPKTLSALTPRPLAEIEQRSDARTHPPVVSRSVSVAATPEHAATVTHAFLVGDQSQIESTEMQALRPRIDSGANWFYWVAALSAVNAVSAALGSSWRFVLGLGMSEVLTALADTATHVEELPTILNLVLWAINFALIAGIAYIGWRARRPAPVLFAIGIGLFTLDALLSLLAVDVLGIAFHALALFFMWQGFSAARQYKQLAGG